MGGACFLGRGLELGGNDAAHYGLVLACVGWRREVVGRRASLPRLGLLLTHRVGCCRIQLFETLADVRFDTGAVQPTGAQLLVAAGMLDKAVR